MKSFLIVLIAAGCLCLAGCASTAETKRADALEGEVSNLRGSMLRLKQENEILTQKVGQAETGMAQMQTTLEQKDKLLAQQQQLIEAMEIERRQMRDLLEQKASSLE